MGDADNTFASLKKRTAERQMIKEYFGLDDDEDTSGQDTETFPRASDDVLAQRRIVEVRRPSVTPSVASNPFTGNRLVSTTDLSAATVAVTSADESVKSVSDDIGEQNGVNQETEKIKDDSDKKSESKVEEEGTELTLDTGGENGKAVFTADSVLFEFLDGGWKERGKGVTKVNVSSVGTGKARLVMRARGNYRLILNASLYPGMKLTAMEKKGVTFACMNSNVEGKKDELSTFAFKFKDASIVEEFRAVVTEHTCDTVNSKPTLLTESEKKIEQLLELPAAKGSYLRLLDSKDLRGHSHLWRHIEKEERNLADILLKNMSYKLPSSADLSRLKASNGDKVVKDRETTLVPSTQESNKRRRFETCEGDEFTVHVPPESCVFTSPASIEAHIEAIPSQKEKEHLRKEGLENVTDDMVSSSYRTFIDTMYVRKENQRLFEDVKSNKKEISDLKVEKDKAGEELRSLRAKLETARKSLEAEREKSAVLHDQLDGIAYKAMAKGRGELAIEYRDGLSSNWDIEGMIETYKDYCPEDFEESVVELNGGVANGGHTDGETENASVK